MPKSFRNLTSVEILSMFEYEDLEEFTVGGNNLLSEEELDFGGCGALKMIPKSFGNFTND